MSTIRLGTLSLLLVSSLSLALAAGGCKQEEAGAADDTSASADPGPAETDPGLADEGPADEGQPDPGPPDVVDEGPAALDEGQDPGEAPDAFPCGEEPAPCENQIGVCEGTVKPPELCVEGEWLPCGEAVYAAQRPTFQPAGETLCDAADNDCDGTEDEGLTDCRCGNGVCDPAEAVETCPCDCATCGDGVCSPCGEDPLTCPDDCCRSPEGTSECGDGYCIGFACGENPTICPEDCGTDCGNGTCE